MCPGNNRQDEEILIEYCAGTLEQTQAAAFERHFAECGDCARLVAGQRSVFALLDGWEPADISADFDHRLYARIAQENAEPAWLRWLNSLWKPALVTATAGAALAVMFMVQAPPAGRPHAADPSQHVRMETLDIDQVETALEDLELLTPSAETATL